MKKILFILLIFVSFGAYSQNNTTTNLNANTVSDIVGIQDSLNLKVDYTDSNTVFVTPTDLNDTLGYYVDTATAQNIEGVKTFKDIINLRDTIILTDASLADTSLIYDDGDTLRVESDNPIKIEKLQLTENLIILGGAVVSPTTAVTSASYTTVASDNFISVNYAGEVTIDIRTADIIEGRVFCIKDISGDANINNIIITTEGAETIEGLNTYIIDTDYGIVTLKVISGNLYKIN